VARALIVELPLCKPPLWCEAIMAEHRLMRRVEEVAGRLQRVRRFSTRARIWLLLAIGGLVLLAANAWLAEPVLSPPLTIAAGLVLILGGGLLGLRARANAHDAALAVERRYPDLDSRPVTALAQRPDYEIGGFSFLQSEVISEALLHAQRHDWRDAVPPRSLAGARFRQAAALVLCAAAFTAAAIAGVRPADPASRPALADGGDEQAGDEYRLRVEPGDVELERGTALPVMARFGGKLPEQVTLVASAADGTLQELPLSKSLKDPLFGGRIASVASDLKYHVRFDDRQSDVYRVRVFDYPQLLQADATIVAPAYTGLEVKHTQDVRRVSVVEGSKLTLTCTLNKPVAGARLFDDLGDDLTLTAEETIPNIVAVTWTPLTRRTLTLELIDDSGRHNKYPPEFVIDVIPNQPPDLRIAFPARDMRVSPLQELPLEAQVLDDFGLQEFGLVYQLPDGLEQTLKLGDGAGANAKVSVAHELSFESFQAQPNDLVAYYFYADDVGPDGDARRTLSNMYFAEVRHFDELFRRADSSSGGASDQQQQQQGEGSPAQQLLKLQREIVTATWNLVRRERGTPSPEFPEDAGVIADSQAEAMSAGQQMQGNLEDLLSQQYLTEALKQMTTGEKLLREASGTPTIDPLGDARLATQAAYSALLKLQAREHLVQQSQNSQSSSSSSGQQQQLQQQLQQLELKNDRNRYESEQQAGQQSEREAMQVLNRLRELARRQGDLNEKIKELENALRAAQTREEREEIERQLKRLQQEQQQLLRDLEEAQERMEQPQNRSQMAEARQQLEQTREHLRQTQESLEQGQVSKALAEGTRAERQLEDLKEQFRDRTAGQFEERMRQLRRDTRELAENEEQLSQQLAGNRPGQQQRPTGGRPQLRDEQPAGDEKDPQEMLAEQQQKLSDIMKQAEDIVRDSETSEPLLSKKLYDAVRNTRVDQPQESLTMTSQFLRLGLTREAAQAEQQARRGIDKLREGVEQAAESVLGNESEALERARRELDQLSRSIASELAQADPNFAEEQQRQAEERQRSGAEDSRTGEQREGDRPGEQPQDDENAEEQGSGDQSGQGARANPEQNDQQPGSGEGERTGTQPRDQQQPPEGARPGESSSQQRGQQSGQSQQNDSPEGEGGRSGEPSEQPEQGQSPGGQSPQQEQQAQSQQDSQPPGQQAGQGGQRSSTDRDNPLSSFLRQGGTDGGGSNTGPHLGLQRPLTSSEFVQWSDRMRDVEEMLDNPDLRAEVARIRDRAREMRIDVKRHSKQPNWELVRTSIYGPMLQLQDRVAEELARLKLDSDQIVPLDRDPVPDRYSELVRQYYERLGAGR
jgi:hypothetical protein